MHSIKMLLFMPLFQSMCQLQLNYMTFECYRKKNPYQFSFNSIKIVEKEPGWIFGNFMAYRIECKNEIDSMSHNWVV